MVGGKESMRLGFWMCFVLAVVFAVLALLFGLGREKAAQREIDVNLPPQRPFFFHIFTETVIPQRSGKTGDPPGFHSALCQTGQLE